MTKALPVLDRTTGTGAGTSPISDKAHRLKHHHQRTLSPFSFYSPKLSVYILSTCVLLFILFHIQYSLHTPPSSPSPSWSLTCQWQRIINTSAYCNSSELKSMADRLLRSVTFLPLKDLRYAQAALQGHTWFMSSMYDSHEEGEVQFQQFPSESSQGRLLCMKGRDKHDGSWNSYALAWPETLPLNATFMKGLTFVSYNHYNYDNMWHGLSAMVLLKSFYFMFGMNEIKIIVKLKTFSVGQENL
jgi:heme/copper-type cytochrome/quinol oxidase subunit 3